MSSFGGNDALFQLKVFVKLWRQRDQDLCFFQVVSNYKYQ